MNKRGAYFFVIDAFLASVIVIGALIIIFTSRQSTLESAPSAAMLDDFVRMIETTTIRNVGGNYTQKLVDDGNITDRDNTILEQVIEFYYLNVTGKDTRNQTYGLLKEAAKGLISEHRSIMVYMYTDPSDKELVFNKSLKPADQSELLLTAKRVNFKRINETFIYGPVVLEVKFWV